MGRLLRRLLVLCGILLLLLVGALGAGWAWLDSPGGQRFLTEKLAAALGQPGHPAEVSGLGGALPFHLRLGHLGLPDRQGVWLTIDHAALDLDPRALLDGMVRIDRLNAGRIAVLRLPTASAQPAEPSASSSAGFALPHLPVAVDLDNLSVDHLSLARGVIGQKVEAALEASARLHQANASAFLALSRIDGAGGAVSLSVDYGPEGRHPDMLHVYLHAEEPTGALAARFLPASGALPLTLDLTGQGPLDDWRGHLNLGAGKAARIAADLALAKKRIELGGEARIAPLLPAAFRSAVGEIVPFFVAVPVPGDGPLRLDIARLHLAAGTVAMSGSFDPKTEVIAAKTALGLDLARLGGLAGLPLQGMAEGEADLGGTPAAPDLKADLAVSHLAAAGYGASGVTLHLGVTPVASGRLHVTATADMTGAVRGDELLPGALGGTVEGRIDLTADRSLDAVNLASVTLKGTGLDVAGTGDVSRPAGKPMTASGHADIAVADLAPYGALAGRPLAGAATLSLDLATPTGGGFGATLSGGLKDLRFGVPAAEALLGPSVTLKAVAIRKPDGALNLSHLEIAGSGATLTASGGLDAAGKTATGKASLALPKLALLSKPLGLPLGGSATIEAAASGPATDPALTVTATGQKLLVAKDRIDRLTLGIKTAKLSARRADIQLAVNLGKLDARLAATVAQPGPNKLAITGLSLDGPESHAEGAVTVDLKTRLASGKLTAESRDLGAWAELAGVPAGGHATLSLTLGTAGGQSADLDLTADGLSLGPASAPTTLSRLSLTAHLRDLMRVPQGTLDLAGTDLHAPGLTLARTHLHAEAGRDGIVAFNAGTAGKWHDTVSLDLAGTARRTKQGGTVTLAQLKGALGKLVIAQRQPLVLGDENGALKLAGLDLGIGKGALTGGATRQARSMSLDLSGHAIPVGRIAQQLGQDGVAGTLGLEAHLAGSYRALAGKLTIAVPDLKLAAADHPELPALDFATSLTLASNTLTLDGQIHTLRQETIHFGGSLPIVVAPDGSGIDVPKTAPIQASLTGEGKLDDLASLLPLGEDSLGGTFGVNLNVTGTLAHPEAGGRLRITDGQYDSLAAGTTLRGLNLELDGDASALELKRLDANDGGAGRLSGRGKVVLDQPGGPGLDLDLDLTAFTATRLDEAMVVASGKAHVSGTALKPKLDGDIAIDKATIAIPDTLPTDVPVLEVDRIDSRHPHKEPPPKPLVPPVSLALAVKISTPGQIFVRGRGLDSQWKTDLDVGGTSDAPTVSGTLTTVRGTYSLLGKDFTITQGTVTFIEGTTIDPELALTAEYVASDSKVDVTLKGPAAKPQLTLTSDPVLPQDEILARVLFNTGVGSMTPLQALQLAQAVAALSGHGPNVLDKVRSVTGLDQLGVSSSGDTSGGGALAGTTVSGGKYIAPGVFLGVDRGIGQSTTRGRLEVELTPHISADAAVGAASASSNLGLTYHLDY
jgi:translocation and assembly module TamB